MYIYACIFFGVCVIHGHQVDSAHYTPRALEPEVVAKNAAIREAHVHLGFIPT